ncbi:MAG: hypothetical protein HYZ90_04140 [Candidatus Omnitrophica bacterium]|nr:hypothetical protein [Candidatus Omnitrophota bacterium]
MVAPLKLGVSYYGNRIPWRVKEDLQVIRDAGCTYVVHTLSEEDLEFYEGAMAEIVRLSHELGLEVWLDPWGVGQAFGGETYSSLIAKHLPLRQVNSLGESLPIACPNQEGFREYLLKWIQAARKCGADLLFWDEPHFMIYPEPLGENKEPKLWACRCGACEKRFKNLQGSQLPERLTDPVRAFKEECLVEFTRWLCDETKRAGLKTGVCLLPFESSSTVNDWAKVVRIPSLDLFGTDPYWRPHQPDAAAHVARFARRVKELCDEFKKEPQLWILNFNIPKGEESAIPAAIEAAYREGIRNFAAWSYYGASYIKLRAEDPDAVWTTLSACYQDLMKRKS